MAGRDAAAKMPHCRLHSHFLFLTWDLLLLRAQFGNNSMDDAKSHDWQCVQGHIEDNHQQAGGVAQHVVVSNSRVIDSSPDIATSTPKDW